MRDADDHIALLLLLQHGSCLQRHLSGIQVFDTHAVLVGHQAFQLGADGKDTNLHTVALDDDPRLGDTLHHCACKVIVGTKDGEIGLLEHLSHILQAEVKLMIADGRRFYAHLVHQSNLHFTLKHGEVGRTLPKVA